MRTSRLAIHWRVLMAMVLGAAVGVALNRWAGRQFTSSGTDSDVVWQIEDTPNRSTVRLTQGGRTTQYVVDSSYTYGQYPQDQTTDASGDTIHYVITHGELQSRHPQASELFQRQGRSRARWWGDAAGALGGLVLRLFKMVAIPLIVSALINGVTGLEGAGRFGRMLTRILCYYFVTTVLAVTTGIVMVNLISPGLRGRALQHFGAPAGLSGGGLSLGEIIWSQIENLIPPNVLAAITSDNFLSIIAFSMAFSIFAVLVGGRPLEIVRELSGAVFEIMMRMTMAIIEIVPIGVFCLMLSVTATQGLDIFRSLGWYMLTVALALAWHACVNVPLILRVVGRRSPIQFARAMSPALLTAFSSASSNATLPLSMSCLEHRFGVSNRVTAFTLPLGATVNMDGTALYEAVAVMFIYQWTKGAVPLTEQIVVALTALVASVGTAGIPHAGLVMMVIVLQAVGLPTESQGLILAVDRILDMCRTTVNVWSDTSGCVVVASYEPDGFDHSPQFDAV